MKRWAIGLMAVVVLVGGSSRPQCVEASITFTYCGTLGRAGADNAGLEGADFTVIAEFPSSPYTDDGFGEPALFATATIFTVSDAPLAGSNGTYSADDTFVIFPRLGGAGRQTKFVHDVTGWTTGPRLIFKLQSLFGGDGLDAIIGQMPQLSHLPTSISDLTVVALPHNIPYDVTNPSITTVDSNVIPEPSNASFNDSSDLDPLNIDFGIFAPGDPASPQSFSIWNIAPTNSADLNLDSITETGDTDVFTTDLFTFSALGPGESHSFAASFDTSMYGDFGVSYTLNFSDVTGTSQPSLVLNLSGSVVPEPTSLIIWSLLGTLTITVGWWRRRRAARGF